MSGFREPPPRWAGRIAEGDGRTEDRLWRDAEEPLRGFPRIRQEPPNRRTNSVRPGRQHDAFGEPAFVEGFALWPLSRHHQQHAERGVAQVADISAKAGERLQRLVLADDDDLAELTIARAARPAADLQDVLDDVVRDRLALKFPHCAEAAQEIGELARRSFDGHPNFSLPAFPQSRVFVMVSKGARVHAASSTSQKEVKEMNLISRVIIGAGIAGSLLTGGLIGAAIAGPLGVSAATSSSAAATAASPAAGSGTFVPNETAAHEAGESAAREAQENAGQMPTVP